ncbi:hypothetical protein G7075_04320 [Phycicoccus sp. HDW14]|uniref:phage major capsid protein n=1 Tax=Phycicoccus sp. HDW14 TaxID=2714941 RepID=UPI00140A8EA8|nr:hypothetical protein [Phycicoccus sp. HDW14]QIM19882.1 hypothetical protein G7075_00020 [Phycicoccus sp. HDW14]QIM20543.1 hypothetical protein G7075_04320 [Phycicoccus sp. HDW14]
MGAIYPSVPTQAEIDIARLHQFMKDPTKVNRLVNDENANTFLSDFIFPTTIETNGAVLYEVSAGVYLTRNPEEVAPGAVYPRAMPTDGDAAFAKVPKVGIDVPVTDEKLLESNRDEIQRAARQVGRSVRRQIDTPAVAIVQTVVTKTVAKDAKGWWYTISKAVGEVNNEPEDYEADTVLVPWDKWADVAYDVLGILPRENQNGVVQTNRLPEIAGITIAPAVMPAGSDPVVLDRKVFGSRAFKRIPSPEYTGDPKTGIETWTRRNPLGNDETLIRGRRPMIAIAQEPRAARRITGA